MAVLPAVLPVMSQTDSQAHYWVATGIPGGEVLSDGECVELCRRGDTDSFRHLVERYQRLVFSFLIGRLRDPHLAEEAAQEAFVRAFQSLGKLRKPESFYAWLLGIADRVAKEQLRSPHGCLRQDSILEDLPDDVLPTQDLYLMEEALSALPETSRRLIQLRYYEGLSCQEVALRLKIPLGTVTKTLSRAFAQLRQELKKDLSTSTRTQRSSHELH
jgi:RNA polymerase sigma-70 factor (ECF subfamily)